MRQWPHRRKRFEDEFAHRAAHASAWPWPANPAFLERGQEPIRIPRLHSIAQAGNRRAAA